MVKKEYDVIAERKARDAELEAEMNRVYKPEDLVESDPKDESQHVRVPLIIHETRAKTWRHNPYRKEFDRMRGVTFYPTNMPDWYHRLPPYGLSGT